MESLSNDFRLLGFVRPVACGLAVALALTGAACRVEYQPPSERAGRTAPAADTTLVLSELRSYYRDFSARDWPAFADHFWPGATITTRWQPPGEDTLRVVVTSVPDFVARAPQGAESRAVFDETMLDARIRVTGDLAQAWVGYQARFGDPGNAAEWRGVDAFTLLLHAGRWRIVALAFQSDGGP